MDNIGNKYEKKDVHSLILFDITVKLLLTVQ